MVFNPPSREGECYKVGDYYIIPNIGELFVLLGKFQVAEQLIYPIQDGGSAREVIPPKTRRVLRAEVDKRLEYDCPTTRSYEPKYTESRGGSERK